MVGLPGPFSILLPLASVWLSAPRIQLTSRSRSAVLAAPSLAAVMDVVSKLSSALVVVRGADAQSRQVYMRRAVWLVA
ncbi:hypothetical protein D3C78_1562860 [compost metagenome]